MGSNRQVGIVFRNHRRVCSRLSFNRHCAIAPDGTRVEAEISSAEDIKINAESIESSQRSSHEMDSVSDATLSKPMSDLSLQEKNKSQPRVAIENAVEIPS